MIASKVKNFLIIFLLVVFLFCLAVFYSVLTSGFKIKTKEVAIDGHQFQVQVADTSFLQTRGLSGVKFLPLDQGMIFLFQKPDYYSFWMKGMNFPLDFIWINGNRIASLTQNVPAPTNNSKNLPIYLPDAPVDKVLEINAGLIEKYNFKVGDLATFNF